MDVVDLQGRPNEVARSIDQACQDVGFFAVAGHGVDQSLVRAVVATAEAFFAEPLDVKLQARHHDPSHPYGYFPMASEALARSTGATAPPDLKESFNLAPPFEHRDDTGRFGGVARIWPAIDGFEAVWTAYYDAMVLLADRLLDHMADALAVDRAVFRDRTRRHMSALRAASYPPLTDAPVPGQLRAGAHTDYGTLTILLPGEGSGGLEILTPAGSWVRVRPVPGAFVVNIGDLMARWTDDRWRSTLHRVALPTDDVASTERRLSLAFFHQPDWDAEITSLSGRTRYPTIRFGDWLTSKFSAASNV